MGQFVRTPAGFGIGLIARRRRLCADTAQCADALAQPRRKQKLRSDSGIVIVSIKNPNSADLDYLCGQRQRHRTGGSRTPAMSPMLAS
jgi:hypothetical protein